MAKVKKTETESDPVKAINTMTKEDQDKRIAELEAKLRDSEEKALKRVCTALGVDPDEVKTAETRKPTKPISKAAIRMWVANEVNVNGIKYVGDVTVPLDTARVIMQAIGDRRQRILRELTGNNYILQELQGGGFAPKLVGQVDAQGEIILNGGKRAAGAVVV